MLGDLSIQKDDVETLMKSAPLYNIDSDNFELYFSKYNHLTKIVLSKYLNKDGDFFKIFNRVDEIPDKSQFFYHHFPKIPTNLDNDHHVFNHAIFLNHFYLGRWLPGMIQRLMFPLENLNDTNRKLLNNKSIPTINECRLCEKFNGLQIFNRRGEWFCVYKGSTDINMSDELGLIFFRNFQDFVRWRKNYSAMVENLQTNAFNAENLEDVKDIELNLERYKKLRNSSCGIHSDCIISIKG